MCDLYSEEIKKIIKETGFDWRKNIKIVDNLVDSIKMNLSKYGKRKRTEDLGIYTCEKKEIDKFYASQYECNNSGILLIPTQNNEFGQLSNSELFNHSELQKVTVDRNIENKQEVCIFDETLSKNLFEEEIVRNSTPTPTIIGCDKISNLANKTQNSPTIKTSSSITFLSKNIGIKKRKLILPPIIYGRRLRSENNNKLIKNNIITSQPKRKMKLKGDNCVKEYFVYRDEDYGIIDNTDRLLLQGENVHRQDDDRQTTSEVQDWAIGLVKRYLGETVKLIRQESSKINSKPERIRALRQRFGFPTKVREL
ncbi:hypothetical protein CPHLJ_1g2520 [Cryptosporidium parvum]|uniref:Uncharacterized protein n=1 Tax=Cryptosporidium parvum TaxID=5807 RepID=A0A7S7RHU0_CRYPV|nr:Uncharacterized protein CPATCC_0036810 [Cryptosporidium parvum]WRK30646.1 Uncharacterized protein cpbgf_1002520 [Cryptosporidium parvum]|eukprot:QOY43374.1 hypothetical protein CPATCC_000156 [Cryptosporidium parvum]